MFRLFSLPVLATCLSLFPAHGFAASMDVVKTLDGPSWSYQGKPTPSTYWSPWWPPAHVVVRYKMGIRFSTGTMAVKCPAEVTFTYDPEKTYADEVLTLRVAAQPVEPSNAKAFESSFGVYLPTRLQVGLIGVSGVPSPFPWKDINYDLWELIGLIPKAGSYIASAKDQIGVNMASGKDDTPKAVPLGTSVEYHDQRSLIDLTEAALSIDAVKDSLVDGVFGKIPKSARNTLIDLLGQEELKKQIGKGIGKLAGVLSLTIEGDPFYKLTGEQLIVHLRYWVPGMVSGTYPVILESTDGTATIDIPIPSFATDQDKLYVTVDRVEYAFKLEQTLRFELGVPVIGDVKLIDSEQLVDVVTISKDLSESASKFEIPLKPAKKAIQNYHIIEGCTSATARWATAGIPMRGTVRVYQGSHKIAEKTESSFRTSHSIEFVGLEPRKTYRFAMACVDASGHEYTVPALEATTLKSVNAATTKAKLTYDGATWRLYDVQATASGTSATFTWKTDAQTSTEVFYSLAPDLQANYTTAIKKANEQVVVGYISDGARAEREMATVHSLTVPDLEPGNTYHFQLVSWTFVDNDPTKTSRARFSYVGSVDTTPLPADPMVRYKTIASSGPLAGLTLVVVRQDGAEPGRVYVTGSDGLTPDIVIKRGVQYGVSVNGGACYQDRVLSLPAYSGAADRLSDVEALLQRRPDVPGTVVDRQGQPVAGATVTLKSQGPSCQTGIDGSYVFHNVDQGNYNLKVAKAGYRILTIPLKVTDCGIFKGVDGLLDSSMAQVNLRVTTDADQDVAGATVTVKKGSSVLATLTTDAQGLAAVSHDLGQSNSVKLKFEVAPPASQPSISAMTDSLTLEPGMEAALTLVCPQDVTGPIVSNISIQSQPTIEVSFKTDESATACVEVKGPDDSVQQTAWVQTLAKQFAITVPGSPPGDSQVRILTKDQFDNTSQTAWQDCTVFGGAAWQLQVTSIKSTSATVKWQPYPGDGFSYYRLNAQGPKLVSQKITKKSTTEFELSGLNPKSSYQIELTAFSSQNVRLAPPATTTFTTALAPARLYGLETRPSLAVRDEPVSFRAKLRTEDWTIEHVEIFLDGQKTPVGDFETKFGPGRVETIEQQLPAGPGAHTVEVVASGPVGQSVRESLRFEVLDVKRPRFQLLDSQPAPIRKPSQIRLRFLNEREWEGKLYVETDWGDGRPEKKKVSRTEDGVFTLKHSYREPDDYTVQFEVLGQLPDRTLLPSDRFGQTSSVLLKVTPKVPTMSVTVGGNGNTRGIRIKARQQELPISWTLDFGDGSQAATGTGKVDQDVQHTYPTVYTVPGAKDKSDRYKAVFKVTDSMGYEYAQIRSVSVEKLVPGASGGSGSLQQRERGEAEPERERGEAELERERGETEPERERDSSLAPR